MNEPTRSKINAIALIIALVNAVAAMGYIDEAVAFEVVTVVNTLGPMLIMVARTWFTGDKK